MKKLQNRLDVIIDEIVEEALKNSTTFGDARNYLRQLKNSANYYLETSHLVVIYEKALSKLEKKMNATQIKE